MRIIRPNMEYFWPFTPLSAPSESFYKTIGHIGVYESLSTHSSALILKRSTAFCFTAKSAILHKYARTNVVTVNIEGIAGV